MGNRADRCNVPALDIRGPLFGQDERGRQSDQVGILQTAWPTNIRGARNSKRYKDVIDILDNGISVITAVNIQHIESLNDVVSSTIGIKVHETVPDSFFRRAYEIIDVGISIDTPRTRLRQGKIYSIEKIVPPGGSYLPGDAFAEHKSYDMREVGE